MFFPNSFQNLVYALAAAPFFSSGSTLLMLSIDERIFVKCRGNRELRGKLHVSPASSAAALCC